MGPVRGRKDENCSRRSTQRTSTRRSLAKLFPVQHASRRHALIKSQFKLLLSLWRTICCGLYGVIAARRRSVQVRSHRLKCTHTTHTRMRRVYTGSTPAALSSLPAVTSNVLLYYGLRSPHTRVLLGFVSELMTSTSFESHTRVQTIHTVSVYLRADCIYRTLQQSRQENGNDVTLSACSALHSVGNCGILLHGCAWCRRAVMSQPYVIWCFALCMS